MKYTRKYFKENLPAWKRMKDPILSKIFYRPLSFYLAAICANMNIMANTVSYFSALVGILACGLFLVDNYVCAIIGAILINIWLLLDCVDGNLARSVKRQPFGEFVDAISSYILVGLMCTAMGVHVYYFGGVTFSPGNTWIILIGAFASEADTLMRLVYQKYKNTEADMSSKGIVKVEEDIRMNQEKVGSLQVRIEAELGIGGFLPFAILVGTIFKCLDLVIIYCILYYGMSCVGVITLYVKKTIQAVNKEGNI